MAVKLIDLSQFQDNKELSLAYRFLFSNNDNINSIALEIVKSAIHNHNGNISEVLQILNTYNWDEIANEYISELKERKLFEENRKEKFLNEIILCDACHKSLPRKESRELPGKYGLYCGECHKKLLFGYYHICPICGNEFSSWKQKNLCINCDNSENRKELSRVYSANARTQKLNLLSNLSTNEWFEILKNNNWHCNKCKKNKHDVLHHIVHVENGGGTIASNVIPLCHKCHRSIHSQDKYKFLLPLPGMTKDIINA